MKQSKSLEEIKYSSRLPFSKLPQVALYLTLDRSIGDDENYDAD
jgi:hypothetical protein